MTNELSIAQRLDRIENILAVVEVAARALGNGTKRDLTRQEEEHAVDPALVGRVDTRRHNADRVADLGRQWAQKHNPHYRGR